jgi:hypothetical protein
MNRDFLITVLILCFCFGTSRASQLLNLPNMNTQQVVNQSLLHGISRGTGVSLILAGLGCVKLKFKSKSS